MKEHMEHLPEAIEKDIPEDRIIDLKQALYGDSDSQDDYEMIEDLTSSILFSQFEERRQLAAKALSGFLETPIQVFTTTTETEVYAYLCLNGIEDGFFFVRSYPNIDRSAILEPVPSEREINALRTLASKSNLT